MPTATKKKAKKAKLATKAKRIHIGLLGDESGSMMGKEKAVLDGFNEFVGSLQGEKNADKARVTIGFFDGNDPMVRFPTVGVKLKDYERLTSEDYRPRGSTPLYDSIAHLVFEIEPEMKKDDKALIVIFTDGMENASREYDAEKIRKLISKKEKKGFDFIFLGANIDSHKVGASMGMAKRGQTLNTSATPAGIKAMSVGMRSMGAAYLAENGSMAAVLDSNNETYAGGVIPEDAAEAHGVKKPTGRSPVERAVDALKE